MKDASTCCCSKADCLFVCFFLSFFSRHRIHCFWLLDSVFLYTRSKGGGKGGRLFKKGGEGWVRRVFLPDYRTDGMATRTVHISWAESECTLDDGTSGEVLYQYYFLTQRLVK